ncbi:hypothetical protein C3L33_13054, partial [Rhododendron williamsianum]
MTDLAVPSWVDTPEEFIKLHRSALESDRVSCHIHHWIDITFGCKMSGEAAVAAKNVMLPASEPTMPRSVGRPLVVNGVEGDKSLLLPAAHIKELEEAAAFCEHARYLSPLYCYNVENFVEDDSSTEESLSEGSEKNISTLPDYAHIFRQRSSINLDYLLEKLEVDDDTSVGYQELLLWSQKSSHSKICSETIAKDIFSIGCILAELHLRRPLFNPASLAVYLDSGVLPSQMKELPPRTEVLVESCLSKDWRRRPSAKCLLESPYFATTVRSSYLFLGPLQLLAKDGLRLRYAANFSKQGAFKAMGPFAAEMCASYCLPLVLTSLSDIEAEWAYTLLKELLKCLKPNAVKTLILPAIQKILQARWKHASGYLYLKVLLLQESFVREIWKRNGKQAYLETIHPLVILNLHVAPHKSSAAAAAVLLIGSSEELGIPATVHQTILPLIQCFGKGICSDGIDVVVRIGGLLGENFVVRQILPLLTNVVRSCIDASYMTKPEPMQNWSYLALIDCLMSLDGMLDRELVLRASYAICLQKIFEVAATSLIAICERIGPDLTALHVLPKLKELFDELAFSQETRIASGCATWLLLEQFLLRCHNWKWEHTGESSRCGPDNINSKRPIFNKSSTSEYNPAKLLLNGVGWSTPQSQGSRSSKNLVPLKQANELDQSSAERRVTTSTFGNHEPWHWFPSPAASWDGPDFLGRFGNLKDELPWKIRASVIHSIRAHHGALRSLAVCQDECTVFTAGVGPGFKGTVQRWDLSRSDCISAYYGHEEAVNDISIFSSYERVASCDGTVHVWNSQTGKLISIFAESSMSSVHASSPLTSPSKINADQSNMLNSSPPSSGILSAAFDGSLYTCMHHLQFNEKLVVGTGNGSLRFIDVPRGQKLHLWKTESGESSFPSLISSICACGSDKMQADGAAASPSWIAAGLSSGMCRLLDVRSGNVISTWRAHDGYVTKLAAPADHLLVSSSLDRTLRVWDLRRNWPPQPIVFRGHNDSVSGFSVWGQDVISIAKNKIGLSSLSRSADEDGQHRITPQYLYLADRGMRNMSVLSSLSILPFSRLFLVGTEDGHLKICC